MKYLDAGALHGKTVQRVDLSQDELRFVMTDGSEYLMFHSQDCCESVSIVDIVSPTSPEITNHVSVLGLLVGSPLVSAHEQVTNERPAWADQEYSHESATWTEYLFGTTAHEVRIRWEGTSNGYYSETVQIDCVREPDPGYVPPPKPAPKSAPSTHNLGPRKLFL